MNEEDPMQENIRRATGHHALRQIHSLVDKENADDEFKARTLRWLLRYGWLILVAVALLFARYLGVV